MENCHGGILRYTEKHGVKGSQFLIHHNCVKSMPFFRIKVSKMHQNSWILAFSFLIPGHPSVSKGADIHNGDFFFFFFVKTEMSSLHLASNTFCGEVTPNCHFGISLFGGSQTIYRSRQILYTFV